MDAMRHRCRIDLRSFECFWSEDQGLNAGPLGRSQRRQSPPSSSLFQRGECKRWPSVTRQNPASSAAAGPVAASDNRISTPLGTARGLQRALLPEPGRQYRNACGLPRGVRVIEHLRG